MANEYSNPRAIKELLKQLESGTSMPWPKLSCLLNAIEESGYWEETSDSFTEWLKYNSDRIGLKQSTLWRYLVVGRYYQSLREQLSKVKLNYPPLEELPNHVSPEKLELLSKLARVAPRDFFEPAVEMVLENSISRNELRAEWQAFRPALQGKTARGRGVLAPQINPKNEEQYHSVLEAMIINALRSIGPEWLGKRKAHMYDVRMHVWPDYPNIQNRAPRYQFDAVALYKETKSSQLQVHGIEIGHAFVSKHNKFVDMASYCDYLWVVINRSNNMYSINQYHIPDFIGVISVEGTEISVIREPQPCDKDSENSSSLLKGLLVKETRK